MRILDNAPGILLTEADVNLIEMSDRVKLGEGQINSIAGNVLGVNFGRAETNEISGNDTFQNAQDLDLGSWSKQANPDIQDAEDIAHITVRGTGDGNIDFYRFDVSEPMLSAANGQVEIIIDIDNGVGNGDFGSAFWNPNLRLYNEDGLLLQENTYAYTTDGEGGSETVYDPFIGRGQTQDLFFPDPIIKPGFMSGGGGLAGSYITQAGTYYIQVSDGGTRGVLAEADYDLHLSVERHAVDTFIFEADPIPEEEASNSRIDAQDLTGATFTNFFDSTVGDSVLPNGGLSSDTPYATISGIGDGSADFYEFKLLDSMFDVNVGGSADLTKTVNGPWYTTAEIALVGDPASLARVGDTWNIDINGIRSASYNVSGAITLAQVAQQLASQLDAHTLAKANGLEDLFATYSASANNGVITIDDSNGFRVEVSQDTPRAGSEVRSHGTGGVEFTEVSATISGPIVDGDTWTLVIDGTRYSFDVTDASTTSHRNILEGLLDDLDNPVPAGLTPTLSDVPGTSATLQLSDPAGLTLSFEQNGSSAEGLVEISGVLASDAASDSLLLSGTASMTLAGTVAPNETWTFRVGSETFTVDTDDLSALTLDELGQEIRDEWPRRQRLLRAIR